MSHLVCSPASASHLYKKKKHLVRTPIIINLKPDKMSVYQVAGSYSSNNFPNGGFTAQSTIDNVVGMGYECLNAYLTHANPLQIWRNVSTNHKPESVWYQGAYSTTGKTAAATVQDCESYLQLGAYHFSLPQKMGSAKVVSAKINFINGGGIQCYQSAASGHSQNKMLMGFTPQWNVWEVPFHAIANLNAGTTPQQIAQSSVTYSPNVLADTGTPRGARDLWGFSGFPGETSRPDGGIPVLTAPPTKSFDMGDDVLNVLNSNNGCWLIPFITGFISSTTNYRPQYVNPNPGWWACISVWDVTIQITID